MQVREVGPQVVSPLWEPAAHNLSARVSLQIGCTSLILRLPSHQQGGSPQSAVLHLLLLGSCLLLSFDYLLIG